MPHPDLLVDDDSDLIVRMQKRNRLLRERMKQNARLARKVLGQDAERFMTHAPVDVGQRRNNGQ
jgi:hypothetical protein